MCYKINLCFELLCWIKLFFNVEKWNCINFYIPSATIHTRQRQLMQNLAPSYRNKSVVHSIHVFTSCLHFLAWKNIRPKKMLWSFLSCVLIFCLYSFHLIKKVMNLMFTSMINWLKDTHSYTVVLLCLFYQWTNSSFCTMPYFASALKIKFSFASQRLAVSPNPSMLEMNRPSIENT